MAHVKVLVRVDIEVQEATTDASRGGGSDSDHTVTLGSHGLLLSSRELAKGVVSAAMASKLLHVTTRRP